MIDLRLKGTCATCRYWDKRYPQNPQLGVCTVMGLFMAGNSEVAINGPGAYPDPQHPPSSDVSAVRTTSTFGCIAHDPGE